MKLWKWWSKVEQPQMAHWFPWILKQLEKLIQVSLQIPLMVSSKYFQWNEVKWKLMNYCLTQIEREKIYFLGSSGWSIQKIWKQWKEGTDNFNMQNTYMNIIITILVTCMLFFVPCYYSYYYYWLSKLLSGWITLTF